MPWGCCLVRPTTAGCNHPDSVNIARDLDASRHATYEKAALLFFLFSVACTTNYRYILQITQVCYSSVVRTELKE